MRGKTSSSGYENFIQCKESLIAGVGDAPHAHEPDDAPAQVKEGPVLAGPHVHHLASELGLLVHQPVALHHIAGLAVGHAQTVRDVVTVLCQLIHLTSEVLLLVDPHPEGSPVLWCRGGVGLTLFIFKLYKACCKK